MLSPPRLMEFLISLVIISTAHPPKVNPLNCDKFDLNLIKMQPLPSFHEGIDRVLPVPHPAPSNLDRVQCHECFPSRSTKPGPSKVVLLYRTHRRELPESWPQLSLETPRLVSCIPRFPLEWSWDHRHQAPVIKNFYFSSTKNK